MAGPGDFFQDLMDQQVKAMKQYQDTMGETMKAFTDAFSGAPPAQTNSLPDAAALADGYFKLANEVLKRQHEFALRMIEVMSPR